MRLMRRAAAVAAGRRAPALGSSPRAALAAPASRKLRRCLLEASLQPPFRGGRAAFSSSPAAAAGSAADAALPAAAQPTAPTAGSSGSTAPVLPEHLQRIVDDYDKQRAEEAQQLLPRVLGSRATGLLGMGIAGTIAYIVYCFDDVSSEVHAVSGFILARLAPSTARAALVRAGVWGLLPSDYDKEDPYLVAEPLEGLRLVTPLGLGAGIDLHAEAANGFISLGFGFVEVGPIAAASPEDAAAAEAARTRLRTRDRNGPLTHLGMVGASIIGSQSELVALASRLGPHVDFLTVEIRGEAAGEALRATLAAVVAAAASVPGGGPRVFLKIELARRASTPAAAAAAAKAAGADGAVLCTSADPMSEEAVDTAGLVAALSECYRETNGELVLFTRGGVRSGRDLLACVEAGASASEIDSYLLSHGPQVVRRIKNELSLLLTNEGYVSLDSAVGAAHRRRRAASEGKRPKNPWRRGAPATR
eukprot:TRINITY_DN21781_c0_g2_i1.p1 TRINITY_DN21781_c0_g2~~TRINITY_DN21781_c0_g2_i1.p1  ORF type:complete len:492 (-),score=122.44 TRINITY_DN21781_c0_g2_i1:33-1463(-)